MFKKLAAAFYWLKSSENIENKRLEQANLDVKKNMIFGAKKVDGQQKSVKM